MSNHLKKRILVFIEDDTGKQAVRKVEIFDDGTNFGEISATESDIGALRTLAGKSVERKPTLTERVLGFFGA